MSLGKGTRLVLARRQSMATMQRSALIALPFVSWFRSHKSDAWPPASTHELQMSRGGFVRP